jgi:uncharacterized membrane protein
VAVRNRDLLIAVALAAAGGAVVVYAEPVALRVVVSMPLLLVLPGYAVAAAIFGTARLGRARRLLLSVGLSLVTAILLALVLYLTPYDLSSRTWSIALVAVVLAASGIAAVRRGRGPEDRAPGRTSLRLPRLRLRDALLLLAAAAVASGAVAFARTPLPAKHAQGYTALWLLPGDRRAVRVGITSGELHATAYRLRLRLGTRLAYERSVSLEPGQRWERIVHLPRSAVAGTPVTANLFRAGSPQVYRRVRVRPLR